jgi:hypothetical protein
VPTAVLALSRCCRDAAAFEGGGCCVPFALP